MAGGNGCQFRGCLVVGSVLWGEKSDTTGKHYFLGSFLLFLQTECFLKLL